MSKSIIKRIEELERARAEPERGLLLGVVTYSDGTQEEVYSDKQGALQTTKTLADLMGYSGKQAVKCTATEEGKEHTLFSVLFQLVNQEGRL